MKQKFSMIRMLIYISIFLNSISSAQPKEQLVKIVVSPDHTNWQYKTGEKVKFNVSIMKAGHLVDNVSFKYEIRPEQMDIIKSEKMVLKTGKFSIDGETMNMPGFLRCKVYAWVDGKEYSGFGTAGFDVEKIDPTTTLPADFDEFWENAKKDAAKVPMDAKITLLPDRCTETVNVYHVSIQNYKLNSRIYGILAKPKKPGKYPALLKVPGAGVRPYNADIERAEKGIITFKIGIHGIPVIMETGVYDNLRNGGLDHYWFYNLDNKDLYYYKRVYLGCIRAIDFIFSLAEFDGDNLAVAGGSQGGALSIVTSALDSRVKFLVAFYPALCDFTGYLNNRAGGWPHAFDKYNKIFNVTEDKIETSKYYDVVNFARHLKIPGYYSWGFNDTTCPPTSMYAAYNVIQSSKKLYLALDTGHWTYPEQREILYEWLVNQLLGSNN